MKEISFVTGNDEKMRDAEMVLGHYDIKPIKTPLHIDEIQHHEPVNIALAKAESAFVQLQKPLIVNDSNWSIPSLGGFPGGYMKDVTAWLTTEDFLALMQDKDDKRIFLRELVVYIDENGTEVFEALREGKFINKPTGASNPSFAKLVVMEGEPGTISQAFDLPGERDMDPVNYEHWNKFGQWFATKDEN